MGRKGALTADEKAKISTYREINLSYRAIAQKIGRSCTVVRHYIKNSSEYGTKMKGRSKMAINEADQKAILRAASKSYRSAAKIKSDLAIAASVSTVKRVIQKGKKTPLNPARKEVGLMALNRICRTCDISDSTKMIKLNFCPNKYGDKTLLDMLKEVTNIEIKMKYLEKLPKFVCCTCAFKLQNAYDFVIQARETNREMIDFLNGIKKEGCQDEVPMDVSSDPITDIKKEEESDVYSTIKNEFLTDDECDLNGSLSPLVVNEAIENVNSDEYDYKIIQSTISINEKTHSRTECSKQIPVEICTEETNELIIKDEPPSEIESGNEEHVDDSLDTLVEDGIVEISDEHNESLGLDERNASNCNKQTTNSKMPANGRPFKCDQCDKSYRWKRNLVEHQYNHLHGNVNSRNFTCTHCNRTFLHKEYYVSHLKMNHGILPEQSQCNAVDINLCQPHGDKLIQCMLCLQKFTTINDLRHHLNEHPDISLFEERPNETIQEIADGFLINCKDLTEEMLITQIHKDLRVKKFDKFYSITNQSGYELSLSSSESESGTESENDFDIESEEHFSKDSNIKYTCELCDEKFSRKFQVFCHQREQHEWKDAVHVCRHCDTRFVSKLLLEHHYKSQCKNAQKRFKCQKCHLRYRWKQNLVTHYQKHTKNDALQCTICYRTVDDKKSLAEHMHEYHADDSKLMNCHWCIRKFYRKDFMLKHLKRHGIEEKDMPLAEMIVKATSRPHGDKIIQCKTCNLKFYRINGLKAHIRLEIQLNLSKYKSYDSLANYSITNEYGFELHLDDSETDGEDSVETYKCDICQIQCKRKFEMFQHQRLMHRFEQLPHSCEKCIFKCVSKEILDHHRSTQCFNEQKQLSCEKCSYKFMWAENLQRHMLLQHPVETNSDLVDTSVRTTNGETSATALTPCPHCDRIYIQQYRLNKHIREVHTEGGRKEKNVEREFCCSICNKQSQSASDLDIHMSSHTGKKTFKCDMCDMSFLRNCELMQHQRKHTGEKLYNCTVCTKSFTGHDKLKQHMLTHSGLKPHKCTYCEKCYRQAKDLKIHLLLHTEATQLK